MRTTIKLADLLDTVNRRNRESTCSAATRRGWNSLLEAMLHAADAYKGFGYLYADHVPEGEKPGIIWEKDGPGKHAFPDGTRRVYYSA